MKLLRLDDPGLNGKLVWIKRQFIDKFHKLYVEVTYNRLRLETGGGPGTGVEKWWLLFDERIYPILSSSTQISGDEHELAEILKQMGFSVEYRGNSGFAARNRYIITNPNAEKTKVRAPLLISGNLTKEQKQNLSSADPGWEEKRHFPLYSSIFYDAEEEYEGEIIADPQKEKEIELIKKAIGEAKEKLQQKKDEKFIEKFLAASQDGGFSATLLIGGHEDLQYPIPARFQVLAEIRVANTQDYRQHLTHTYMVVLVDKVKLEGKKSITIKVPQDLKGLVIGKNGANIKNICSKLGCCFIKVL